MAKRAETGKPIPNDWNGEDYCLYMLCAPDSLQWDSFVRGAIYELSRGGGWDANTGSITDVQAIAWEVYESMAKCDDLVNILRVNNAILAGETLDLADQIPQNYDYTENGIGPILNRIAGGVTDDLSIQDLIDAIENGDFTGQGFLGNLRDFVEILVFLKLLFGPDTKVSIALNYWDKIKLSRYQHNHLTLMAYQATALRGIQFGITPFEGTGVKTESEILEELGGLAWLGKPVTKWIDDLPLEGLDTLSVIFGGVVTTFYQSVKSAWNYWYEKWINLVGTPEPAQTVTGILTQIAQRLLWDQRDDGGGPYTVTDFTGLSISEMLQKLAYTQVTPDDETAQPGVSVSNRLGDIKDEIDGLDSRLGDFIDANNMTDLLSVLDTSQLVAAIEAINPSVTVNVSCDKCGSSGGCGCTDPPSQPAEEGEDPPPGWETPTDDEGTPVGPGDTAYHDRKCRVANILHASTVELVTKIRDNSTIQTLLSINDSLSGQLALVALGYIIGEMSTIIPFADGIFGIMLALFVAFIDLDDLVTALNDNDEELVCAFYTAPNAVNSVNDYLQVLDDAGVSIPNRELVLAILTYDVVNMVFLKRSALSLAIEDAIANYEPPIPCDCSVGWLTTYNGSLFCSPEGSPAPALGNTLSSNVDFITEQAASWSYASFSFSEVYESGTYSVLTIYVEELDGYQIAFDASGSLGTEAGTTGWYTLGPGNETSPGVYEFTVGSLDLGSIQVKVWNAPLDAVCFTMTAAEITGIE